MKKAKLVALSAASCLWFSANAESSVAEGERLQSLVSAAEAFVQVRNEADDAKVEAASALAQSAKEGEAAALLQLQEGISNACVRACDIASWLEKDGFSKDREGYEKLWKVLDSAISYVKAPHTPKSTLAASRVMKTVGTATYVMSSGLQFLRETSFARDEARLIRNEIEKKLMPYLASQPLHDSARQDYDAGRAEAEAGKAAFSKCHFEEAVRRYSAARKLLASVKSRELVLRDVPIPD